MFTKRSQVTLFAIIGVILIISSASIYFVATTFRDETESEFTRITEENANIQLRNYIENNVNKRLNELIYLTGQRGGTLYPENTRDYDEKEYTYSCNHVSGKGCVSNLYTKSTIEKEFEENILNLLSAVSFENFEDQGYTIDKEMPSVKVSINPDNVIADIDWDIRLNKEEFESVLGRLSVDVDSEIHKMHSLASRIIYEETVNHYFDEDKWMRENGGSIRIYKHKPYPDVVYMLQKVNPLTKERYEYRFAFQGHDTVSNLDVPIYYETKGYCLSDGDVYANVDSCEYGDYSANDPGYKEYAYYEPECVEGECLDCGTYKHGESWCVSDGIAAPGFSAPGTRFFKQTCINGKIYNTECRDYREEICTEQESNIKTATCRINRWRDCAEQTDKNSCIDSSERDCYWADWLKKSEPFETITYDYSDRKCFPYVPPGSKFWEGKHKEVCAMANEEFDCDDTSCPQSWVDSTAAYCYFMGDCGSYFNHEKIKSFSDSFYNSDTGVSDFVYDSPYSKNNMYVLDLDPSSRDFSYDGDEFENTWATEEIMRIHEQEYTERISNSDFGVPSASELFIRALTGKSLKVEVEVDLLHQAKCNVWKNPDSFSDCEKCGQDPRKPCSEYRCKSLGNCNYNEINGKGICGYVSYPGKAVLSLESVNKLSDIEDLGKIFDDVSETANVNMEELSFRQTTYNAEQLDYLTLYGYDVDQKAEIYSPLVVEFSSPDEVICAAGDFPGMDFYGMDVYDGSYSNNPKLIIAVKPIEEQFKELGENPIFVLEELSKINNTLNDIEEIYSGIDISTNQYILDMANSFFGTSNTDMNSLFDSLNSESSSLSSDVTIIRKDMQDILIDQQLGKMYKFVKCRTRKGKETETFIRYDIDEEDNNPVLLKDNLEKIIWESENKFRIYSNEPVECRYDVSSVDHQNMDLLMDCSHVDLNGAYGCSFSSDESEIYLSCLDNPAEERVYEFSLMRDNGTNITNAYYVNDTIDITPAKVNYVAVEREVKVNVESDRRQKCKYDASDLRYKEIPDSQKLICEDNICSLIITASEKEDYRFVCEDYREDEQNEVRAKLSLS